MAQIGVEMNSAARDGKPQPKLCIVEHSDKPELQKLKSTKDRCKAIDVATILGQITGTNRCIGVFDLICMMTFQRSESTNCPKITPSRQFQMHCTAYYSNTRVYFDRICQAVFFYKL